MQNLGLGFSISKLTDSGLASLAGRALTAPFGSLSAGQQGRNPIGSRFQRC